MSERSAKTPNKIRTFASDIETAKAQRGDTTPLPNKEPEQKTTAEPTYAAAPQPLRHNLEKHKKDQVSPASVIPEKKPATPKPIINTIPPFHEIDKKNKSEAAATKAKKITAPHKQSDKNQKSAPTRINIGYDATVITDTKSNRFKLIPSVIESLQTWFKKITAQKKKAAPKYVIPEAQRRKGVIQRATSKTGTIFTADSETLKEQIRRRQQQLQDEPETSWSPFVEPGYALLEAPEDESVSLIQNVQVEYKKSSLVLSNKTVQATTPAIPIASFPSIAPESTDTYTASTQESTANALPQTHDSDTEKIAEGKIEFYEPQNTTSDEEKKEAERIFREAVSEQNLATSVDVPIQSLSPKRQPVAINSFDTNTLAVILLSSIIGLVVIVVVTRIAFQYIQTNWYSETEQVQTTTPILRNTALDEVVISADSIERLPQLINTAINNASAATVELSLVSPLGYEISPSYTFELLQFHTLPTFRQSLTNLRFVTINQSQPTVILQFTDKDTVRGGLLHWEETMATDFSRLYNSQPQNSSLQFTDEKIGETDVRVLRSETETLLVYGFIGERTVLISRTTEDFSQISSFGLR